MSERGRCGQKNPRVCSCVCHWHTVGVSVPNHQFFQLFRYIRRVKYHVRKRLSAQFFTIALEYICLVTRPVKSSTERGSTLGIGI